MADTLFNGLTELNPPKESELEQQKQSMQLDIAALCRSAGGTKFLPLKMHVAISSKAQKARGEALHQQIQELQEKLGFGEDAEKIVKRHITLLHKYNEAKDATQILIGRLAALNQSTIRQIHNDYGLTDED